MLDTIFLCEKKPFLMKYIDVVLKIYVSRAPSSPSALEAQDQKSSVTKTGSKGSTNVDQHL